MMSKNSGGFDPKYDDKKKSDTIYFGNLNKNSDGSTYRKAELIIDQAESYLTEKNKEKKAIPVEFAIKDSVVLHESDGGQQKIHCWLVESQNVKSTSGLHISRRTKKEYTPLRK